MTSERIQAVVARYFAATRDMDPDAWVACFADQATSYEPAAPAPLQGHAALRRFFQGIAGSFQKLGARERRAETELWAIFEGLAKPTSSHAIDPRLFQLFV